VVCPGPRLTNTYNKTVLSRTKTHKHVQQKRQTDLALPLTASRHKQHLQTDRSQPSPTLVLSSFVFRQGIPQITYCDVTAKQFSAFQLSFTRPVVTCSKVTGNSKQCFPKFHIIFSVHSDNKSQIIKPTNALYFHKYSQMPLQVFRLYQAIIRRSKVYIYLTSLFSSNNIHTGYTQKNGAV
jgi:hypothetical protein